MKEAIVAPELQKSHVDAQSFSGTWSYLIEIQLSARGSGRICQAHSCPSPSLPQSPLCLSSAPSPPPPPCLLMRERKQIKGIDCRFVHPEHFFARLVTFLDAGTQGSLVVPPLKWFCGWIKNPPTSFPLRAKSPLSRHVSHSLSQSLCLFLHSHNTKTTSWLDPRLAKKAKPPEECKEDGEYCVSTFYFFPSFALLCLLTFVIASRPQHLL